MPDPIDELENFHVPGPAMNPLPAAEVRRRGTRIRRRNNALAAVGGLAVVAAIATPFAIAANNGPSTDSIPPAGTVEWQQTIPDDFPLGEGMGVEGDPADVGTEPGEMVFSSIDICGAGVWTPEDPASSDVLGAVWSDGIEGGEQRTLAVYASDEAAQGSLDDMRGAVQDCPDRSTGRADYIQPVELSAASGDDSLAYMDQYGDSSGPTGEANAYVVTRVGNALLLDKTYFGGGGSLEVAQQTADLLQERATPVIDAMCVFSAAGCDDQSASADEEPSNEEGAVSAIPAGFPLDRGLTSPEGDPLIGPDPSADGVPALELCGAPVWPATGVDRLAVTATGPEYLETRELVTYASSAEIAAVLDEVRQAATDCPETPDISGSGTEAVTIHEVAPTGADDAVTFSVVPTEFLGGGIYQFARVGRALYATYQSGEWSPQTAAAGAADLTADTEQVLPDLCRWTEQGC